MQYLVVPLLLLCGLCDVQTGVEAQGEVNSCRLFMYVYVCMYVHVCMYVRTIIWEFSLLKYFRMACWI